MHIHTETHRHVPEHNHHTPYAPFANTAQPLCDGAKYGTVGHNRLNGPRQNKGLISIGLWTYRIEIHVALHRRCWVGLQHRGYYGAVSDNTWFFHKNTVNIGNVVKTAKL